MFESTLRRQKAAKETPDSSLPREEVLPLYVGGRPFAVPIDSFRGTTQLTGDGVVEAFAMGALNAITHEGQRLPLLDLRAVATAISPRLRPESSEGSLEIALIAQDDKVLGLVANRVGQPVVVERLGSGTPGTPAGAMVVMDDQIGIVLDVDGLVGLADWEGQRAGMLP